MSEQDFFEEEPTGALPEHEPAAEEMSIDDLIRSTREELEHGVPLEEVPEEIFEPEIPAEYADLTQEELPEDEDDEARPRMPGILKALLYVCLVLAAAVLLAVGAWKCADEVCALTADEEVVTITVGEQDSISDVTRKLEDEGLIRYPWLFQFYCMISHAEDKIEPGTYELNAIYDYRALVYGMVETGENRATVTVTVPEGYELDDIFAMLEEMKVCDAESLREAAANYEFDYWFLEDIAYGDYRRLEGYLFPDTYEFYLDDDPEKVLARFLRNFDSKISMEMSSVDLDALNESLRRRMEKDGYTEEQMAARKLTFHDVVIVASLVEKETTSASESGKIASVIYNRLCSQLYPCLNIEATVQYALPERKPVLTNADKAVISPYNTFTHAGLPVGPIASPGMSSLRAALYPVNTDFYFYALDPAGYHVFMESVYEYQSYLSSLMGEDEQEEEPAQQESAPETENETDKVENG